MIADASQKKKPPTLRNGPPADESFKQSMAEFSRRLGERAAQQTADDPTATAAARRAALEAYDKARSRRLMIGLGAGTAIAIVVGIASLLSGGESVPPPSAAVQTAAAAMVPAGSEPAPAALVPNPPLAPSSLAAPLPASPPGPSPSPSPSPPPSPAPAPPVVEPTAPPVPPTQSQATPAESQAPLPREDVREVQARLRAFGFDPGPADGVAGAMTEDAAMAYQRHRGQRQTGEVDRELLEQLRQDPAPQVAPRPVAQRPQRPAAGPPPPRRSADPFKPLQDAGDQFSRWLNSMLR